MGFGCFSEQSGLSQQRGVSYFEVPSLFEAGLVDFSRLDNGVSHFDAEKNNS